MPDVIEQLRSELRVAASGRPPDEPTAYTRIVRRATRRRVATRVGAVTGLVVVFAAVLGVPRFLDASIGGGDLTHSVLGDAADRPSQNLSAPGCVPEAPADRSGASCGQPGFDVVPTSAVAGTTVEVSGSCGAALGGRASVVSVLLSHRTSRRYTGSVGPDGRFDVPVELPWRLLPARYQLTVSCSIEGQGSDVTGVALLGDRLIDVAKPATATKPLGEPEPATLSATIFPDPQGPGLRLRGSGCYLSALDGALGLVRIAMVPAGRDGPGNPAAVPVAWSDSVVVEPGPDGAWQALLRSSEHVLRMSPYDVYAYCTDDLGGLGFMYQAVYRHDHTRLERVEPSGV